MEFRDIHLLAKTVRLTADVLPGIPAGRKDIINFYVFRRLSPSFVVFRRLLGICTDPTKRITMHAENQQQVKCRIIPQKNSANYPLPIFRIPHFTYHCRINASAQLEESSITTFLNFVIW